MTFNYSDAWILQAIKFSESGDKDATLVEIIQGADYINHAVLTYSEFTTGTIKLKTVGLIIENNKRLQTTDKFKNWWTKKYGLKSRISVLKAMEEIQNYLNKNFGTTEPAEEEIKTEITETDFDKATKEYLQLTSEILEQLRKKRKAK
jgi:hypothetical protein